MGRKKKPAKPEPEDFIREILIEWVVVGIVIGAATAIVLTYAFTSIIGLPPSRTTQGLVSVPAAFAYWAYKAMKRFPGLKNKILFRASADVKVGKQNVSGGSVAPVVGGYKPTIHLTQAPPPAGPTPVNEPFSDLTPGQAKVMRELVEAQSTGMYESAFWADTFYGKGWVITMDSKPEQNMEGLRVAGFTRP